MHLVVILVTGATGNVGAELVTQLSEAGQEVRALIRDPEGGARLPAGVEVAVGDLHQPASLGGAITGSDAAFLLSGYRDMPRLLSMMRTSGTRHVVLLSSGAVGGGEPDNAVVRYNVESETAVRDSGLSWTILRPSGFFSNALRWVSQLRTGDVITEPFADVPVAAIDPADIAAVAGCALTTPGHESAIYRLTGPAAIRPADRVRVLAEILGRPSDCRVEQRRGARRRMSQEMPSEYVEAFMRFFADGTYDDSAVEPTVEDLTGRPPRSFEQWARAHADAFC